MQRLTVKAVSERLAASLAQQPETITQQTEALTLRRDVVTLLTFIRDNKVLGTQGVGNLPLKAVREITARFVNPPKLESTIGTHTYRIRSEEELWPLHYLRVLAEVGGLLKTGSARRWQVTAEGERFLAAEPLLQTAYLLSVWWFKVNWLIAYSFAGMGKALPPFFSAATLISLRLLPVGTEIPYEIYADRLIGATGLTWSAPDSTFSPMLLHGSIERMVIYPLRDFGALTCRFEEKPAGRGTLSELVAFEITPLGAVLLNALVTLNV